MLRDLSKLYTSAGRPGGIVLFVDICYVNCKLVRKVGETALQLLAAVSHTLYLAMELVLRALIEERGMNIQVAVQSDATTYLTHLS